MANFAKDLEIFGFEPREIKLYTFLLSNKDLPVYKIAMETNIPRTTAYKTLESLRKQGFVSSWIKNGVKHFSAESPERLKMLLQKKQEALREAMPEMLNLFNTQVSDPKAKLYLGKEGVKHVFEIILEKVKTEKIKRLHVYSDPLLTEQFPLYFKDWRSRKNKTGTFTHLIVPFGTQMNESYSSNELRETRVMPEEFFFTGSVDICGSLVAFFSFKNNEVYSIVIESPIVAEMLTKLFEYIWKTLEHNAPEIKNNNEKVNPDITKNLVDYMEEKSETGTYRTEVKIGERIIPIDVFPTVFPPEYSSSSKSITEFLGNLSGLEVAEIGCGSGVESIIAKTLGAKHVDAGDINIKAVDCSIHNAEMNGFIKNDIEIFYSDLFQNFPKKKYDMIIANLPIVDFPTTKNPINKALYDENLELHKRFLSEARNYLNKNGIITLAHANLQSAKTNNPNEDLDIVENLIKENGYHIVEKSQIEELGYTWVNYKIRLYT